MGNPFNVRTAGATPVTDSAQGKGPMDPAAAPRMPPAGREQPRAGAGAATSASLPSEFAYENEHPVIPVPFKVTLGDARLDGVALSVTAAYVAINGKVDPDWRGHREVVTLQFDFNGFSVTLFPEVVIAGSRNDGEMTLQFLDPAGPHLPQLRYILNSFIAGDFVTMNGMLNYTGPQKPKTTLGDAAPTSKLRMRSMAVAVMSLTIIVAAANHLYDRATQTLEPRPVFIERVGQDMRATTAGQVVYLNTQAKAGEVVFSINSNSGDVLNFQLPCDCEVVVTQGIFEGATVLPIDVILTFFDSTVGVSVETQMSIEGLAKAMNGERAFLDINDGRSVPARIVVTSATNAAAASGELFVPVQIEVPPGVLTEEDIGKAARLRLSRSPFGASYPEPEES
jgi:hypothetical protein